MDHDVEMQVYTDYWGEFALDCLKNGLKRLQQ